MKKIILFFCLIVSLFSSLENLFAANQNKTALPFLQLLLSPTYTCTNGNCLAWYAPYRKTLLDAIKPTFRLPNSTRKLSVPQNVFSDLYPVIGGFETRYE